MKTLMILKYNEILKNRHVITHEYYLNDNGTINWVLGGNSKLVAPCDLDHARRVSRGWQGVSGALSYSEYYEMKIKTALEKIAAVAGL